MLSCIRGAGDFGDARNKMLEPFQSKCEIEEKGHKVYQSLWRWEHILSKREPQQDKKVSTYEVGVK